MLRWFLLLGGLIVWTVHFFALYAVASIFLTTDLARALTLLITVLVLLANAGLATLTLRIIPQQDQDRWISAVSLWGLGLGTIAIFWQGAVALFL